MLKKFSKAVAAAANQAAVTYTSGTIDKDYHIGKQVASGGHCCLWRIHHATSKTNNQAVSVFIFDKKDLTRFAVHDKDTILKILRRDPSQLMKLRHPRLLEIKTPLEETKDTLMFVTEVVVASVANLMGKYDNIGSGLSLSIKEYSLTDVDKQLGLLQVAEGLNFCHKSARLVHANLSLEALFVDSKGDWKIGGFGFSVHQGYSNPGDMETTANFSEFDQRTNASGNPSLNYMAPERVIAPGVTSPVSASDMFSVGVIMYALWSDGRPVAENRNNILEYQHNLKIYAHPNLTALPLKLRNLVTGLLNADFKARPTVDDILENDFFDDVVINSLQYMQHLVEKNAVEKAEFLQALPRIIPEIPQRIQQTKVLSHLLSELNNNGQVPFLLPNIFLLAERMTHAEFRDLIMPSLVEYRVFSMDDPPQVLICLMEKMEFLLERSSEYTVNSYILPMIKHALDVPSPQLQEMCLAKIPMFAAKMDYSHFKNSVLPKICTLCLETESLKVRVKSLHCMSKLFEVIDKWTVTERLIPTLEIVPSREPPVLMALLSVFYEMLKSKKLALDVETVSGRIIPFLSPLCTDRNLDAKQFKTWINVLKSMVVYIERERGVKLAQQEEVKRAVGGSQNGSDRVNESSIRTKNSDPSLNPSESKLKTKLWAQLDAKKGTSSPSTKPIPPKSIYTQNTGNETVNNDNSVTSSATSNIAWGVSKDYNTTNASKPSGTVPVIARNTSGPSAFTKGVKQAPSSIYPHRAATTPSPHTTAVGSKHTSAQRSVSSDIGASTVEPDGVTLLVQQQKKRQMLAERKAEQQRRLREQQQQKKIGSSKLEQTMGMDGWRLTGPPMGTHKGSATQTTSTINSNTHEDVFSSGWDILTGASTVGSTNPSDGGRGVSVSGNGNSMLNSMLNSRSTNTNTNTQAGFGVGVDASSGIAANNITNKGARLDPFSTSNTTSTNVDPQYGRAYGDTSYMQRRASNQNAKSANDFIDDLLI
eukprot:CFRG6272T1